MTKLFKVLLDPAGGAGGGGTGGSGGGSGGNTSPPPVDWKTTLPPELLANPVMASFKDPVDLAKSWDNAQKLIGAKRIALPGEKATDQEREEFFKAIGRPESVDKYTEGAIKPDEKIAIDKEGLAKAKEQFFKLGLTDAQQKGIMDFYLGGLNENHGKVMGGLEADKAATEEALRKEWGSEYEANFSVVKNVLNHFGDATVVEELQGPIGNNLGLVKMLHKFGKTLIEDKSPNNKFTIQTGTPAAALARIAELRSDVTFQKALNEAMDPGHKAAVELWTQVHRQLG